MVLLGGNALERALREYRLHYLRARNHQDLGNRLLDDFPQNADGPRPVLKLGPFEIEHKSAA